MENALNDVTKHTEDDTDFVLRIDEADINSHANSDEDIKKEDLLKSKNAATGDFPVKMETVESSSETSFSKKDSTNSESNLLIKKEIEKETDSSNLDKGKEDSRFSNHNRLEPVCSENSTNEENTNKCSSNKTGNFDEDTENGIIKCSKVEIETASIENARGNIFEKKENENSLHMDPVNVKNEIHGDSNNSTKQKETEELLDIKQDEELENIDQELDSLLTTEVNKQEDNSSLTNVINPCNENSSLKTLNNEVISSENKISSSFNSTFKDNLNISNKCEQSNEVATTNGMAMDSEDSLGVSETEDSFICSSNSSKNNGHISRAAKSSSDKESQKDSSESSCYKKNKRSNENVDHELKIKKSKISDSEGDSIILNGLADHKRKNNNEELKEIDGKESKNNTEQKVKSVEIPMECDTSKLNGHVMEEELPSFERENHHQKIREQLLHSYLTGTGQYVFDAAMLDELIMVKVVQYLSCASEHGKARERIRVLEKEQVRLKKLANSLKKQVEDAKHIIKKLIDEKISDQPWTHNTQPLKVTRSVGLQVCTCGSINMTTSKSKDRESVRQLLGLPPERANYEKNSENKSNNHNSNKIVVNSSSDLQIVNEERNDARKTPEVTKNTTSEVNSCKSTLAEKNGITNNETRSSTINSLVSKGVVMPSSKTPLPTPNRTSTTPPPTKIIESGAKRDLLSKVPDHGDDGTPLIDLTDNEDSSSDDISDKNKSSPAVSVKPPSALFPPEKVSSNAPRDSPKTSTAQNISKDSTFKAPHSTPTSRKSTTLLPKRQCLTPPAAELVTSYEQLPKFPPAPKYPSNVVKPPRPILKIGKHNEGKHGIMLSWNFESTFNSTKIDTYQLYAYQETRDKDSDKSKPETWKKVGDIKALPLPMACFLTQFVEGHKYHFIVRAVTHEKILGDFSLPTSIILQAAHQAENKTAK